MSYQCRLTGLQPVSLFWCETMDGDPVARALYRRHYSRYEYRDGRQPQLFVGPGEKMVLLTERGDALFVWRKFQSGDGQEGVNCAVFRNESEHRSSDMILDAMDQAWQKWPGERLYTYVNARKVRHKRDPGRCFIRAGWTPCGITRWNRLLIFQALPKASVASRVEEAPVSPRLKR